MLSDCADAIPNDRSVSKSRTAWTARAIRFEWLGQTIASLCWIISVFAYGVSAPGDWLQLIAASAWLLANIAAIATNKG